MNKLLILILVLTNYVHAQEQVGNRLYSSNIENLAFIQYPINTLIKAELKSQSEAKYDFPEALAASIMSCSNATWEAYNTLGGK